MHKNTQKGGFWSAIALWTKALEVALLLAAAITILTSTQVYIGY